MKPECQSTATLLVQLADGDLTTQQMTALDSHLLSCADCRKQYDQFIAIDREVSAYGALVWRQRSGFLRRKRPAFHWIPATVAAVAATLLLGIALLQTTPPRMSETASPLPSDTHDENFVPIPYVPPLAPYESARVIHVEVPVAALAAAGYRVHLTDPAAIVRADLLVGEDGRAHAVRLLSSGILN